MISPVISSAFISPNILLPKVTTEEGIDICVNDEHPQKAQFPIEVAEDGIVICFNDKHL